MKLVVLFLFFLSWNNVHSQSMLSGRVLDQAGEPVPGANVFLQDTYDGATSDADGNFQFETEETGEHLLVVKFIGYKDHTRRVQIDGNNNRYHITLQEAISELDAVTITAGTFTASDKSRRTIFNALDIATTAGATADIAGALNTLPGTQKVGESGRLFVRGGDGHEAKTFIDGMLVLDAYGPAAPNTPSRGRFLPFMFKGTSFSTGGYSAEYGQALSSALVLESKDKAEVTRTDFNILSVGGDVSHTQAGDQYSWAGKIQYTNIRPYFNLINQEIDWIRPPVAIEGSSAFRHNVGKHGMFKMYGNFNHSDFALYNHDIDNYDIKEAYDLTNNFRYINTAYQDALSDDWTIRGGFSYTFLEDKINAEVNNIREREKGAHLKSVVEGSVNDHLELRGGVEVIDRDYRVVVDDESFVVETGFRETITGGFVEGDVFISNKLVTRAGLRAEYNNLLKKITLDPRLSLAYRVSNDGTLSLAYGKFRQSPENEFLTRNNKLDAERADHYIASYQIVDSKRTFRIEAYYKEYNDLIKYSDYTSITNEGYGYAKGLEIFWRDNRSIRNTDYWVSYSFLDTKRNYLNFPHKAVPTFASTHNLSVVYKYFISSLKTQVGTTFSFTTGRPYNDPNADRFNGSRTPYYQDLSLNISYLPSPSVIVYVSGTNLLGRDNIFGYEFSNQQNEEGMYNSRAVRQPAKRFLFIGIFITLSKDKSVNQMPSL